MPRQRRSASASHHHHVNPLMGSTATPSMYTQQPEHIQMPTSYYAVPAGPVPASLPISNPQQASYDVYNNDASELPPTQQHQQHQHRASSGAWTVQDDNQLIQARMQGLNWGQIKDAYFPSKSGNACRKRHERLLERKGTDDWDKRKLQQLAKEYMGMRKEIWSGLAARTGEKWNVVEAKCMSNGLKNLQSAARAASRRDRLETGSHLTGYDDDSGISGIGLTPVDDLDASSSSPEMGCTSSSAAGAAMHSFPTSSAASSAVNYHLSSHTAAAAAATHAHLHHPSSDYALAVYGPSYVAHHAHSSSAGSLQGTQRKHTSGRNNSPYIDGQGIRESRA